MHPPPCFDHDNPSFQQLHSLLSCLFLSNQPSYFLFDYSFFLPEPSGPRQDIELPQPPVGLLKDNTANPYTFPVSPCASLPCILLFFLLWRLQTESDTRLHIALRRFGQRLVNDLKGRRSGYMHVARVEVIKKQHAASV